MKPRLAIIVIGVILLIIIISATFFSSPSKPKQLNLGLATWVGFAPFYISQEKGYFAEEGLQVSISVMDDLAARRAAFSSGKIHAMVDTLDSLANGIPAGLDAKCILKIDESFGGDGIVVTKDINSIADLKGKTVAYQYGLPPQFFLLYLLNKNNLTPSDIKSVDMEASAAAGAFIAKKVDAAVTWEPWLSQAGQTEHGKVLITSAEAPGLITDILVVNPDTINAHRDDIRKLLRAWFKALDFIDENPGEAAKIMGDKLGLPIEEVQGMLMGLRFSSYEDNLVYFGLSGGENQFNKLFNEAIEVWVKEGSVPKDALNENYDPSYTNLLKDLQ